MASKDDVGPLLIAGGAFLLLAKWAVDSLPDLPDIPNPIPPIIDAADEITGGLQKDETESTWEYWTEIDIPFSEDRIPLAPGLKKDETESFQQYFFEYDVPFSEERITWRELAPGLSPDRGDVYTTETTGAVAMDIVEPGQTTGEWLSSIDLPGVDPYNLRDAPGDIWQGVKKLNPF